MLFVRENYLYGEELFSLASRVGEMVLNEALRFIILNYCHFCLPIFFRKLEEKYMYETALGGDKTLDPRGGILVAPDDGKILDPHGVILVALEGDKRLDPPGGVFVALRCDKTMDPRCHTWKR